MRKFKAVIFDLDGTLLDTLDDITQSVNYTLNHFQLPKVDRLDVRRFLGNGARRLWALVLKDNPTLVDKALEIYLPYLEKNSMIQTRPYEGMMDILNALKKDYKLAVVSNKHQQGVEKVINHYFKGIFDVVIGERMNIPKKPDPAPLNLALDLLGIQRNDAIFIGDSEVDVHTGLNAQVSVVGVTWGFRDYEVLEKLNPNYLIHETKEIIKVIQGE